MRPASGTGLLNCTLNGKEGAKRKLKIQQKEKNAARELLTFIDRSPSCFHAVRNMRNELELFGFQRLEESREWRICRGGQYYVTRNDSSLIAFRIPENEFRGFQIAASHSDSPTFKIKENVEITVDKHFTKLNVEGYGGMIMSPWFDRPLSIAGRAMVRKEGVIHTQLVHLDRDLLLIPNLAIHMNREVNSGMSYNIQSDLLPLFGDETACGSLMKMIAQEIDVPQEDILSTDLYLYNRMKGTIWGANEEFLSAPRLDDLQCAFASLRGFLQAPAGKSVAVYCVLDNEEVGSGTKQGAASTFLYDTLTRLNTALGRSMEQYHMALASSMMLSADNAHSVHPNKADKTDPSNRPYLNGGVVVKYNANQKYTTDAVSAAMLRMLCERVQVPLQSFANRSDMPGGSTLGNISNTKVALNTVDIGLAQLAMHSPYETAGVLDTDYLIRLAAAFFSSAVEAAGDGAYCLL